MANLKNDPRKLAIDNHFVPCPVNDNDELYPNGIFVFNITKMIEYVQNNIDKFPLKKVFVKDCWEKSGLDGNYVDSVDIDKPVILAEITPGRCNVIDGNHRVAKARIMGVESLQAYRLKPKEHIKFLTDKKSYLAYVEYWNDKIDGMPKQKKSRMTNDEKALTIWQAQPDDAKNTVLKNVYCGNCGGAVTISDYKVILCKEDIVLDGFCSTCGHKVARVLEGMAESSCVKKASKVDDSFVYGPEGFLTDKQAGEIVNLVYSKLGLNLRGMVNDQWARDKMRLMSLQTKCKKTREEKAITIKQAAEQLKIKQYALKGIEGHPGNGMTQEVLDKYIDFLGIREWFKGWLKVNQDVYDRLGIDTSGMNVIKSGIASSGKDKQPSHKSYEMAGSQEVKGKAIGKSRKKQMYQFKITLNDASPTIWRRIQVINDITLKRLAATILIAMGWTNSHMHQFHIGSRRFGLANEDMEEFDDYEIEDKFRLRDFSLEEIRKFVFEYDFGDGWDHEVMLEKILEPQKGVMYPVCLGGARHCPPEDCGGTRGYADFLKIIADPNHQEHESTLEWVGGKFDPEEFNLKSINNWLEDVELEEDSFDI